MIQPSTDATIERSAALIREGGLVAFPTETVYGLGGDATNPRAVARIFEVKGRPAFDPIIVHVASPQEARTLWTECPPAATKLIQAFWPGPLTLVLPKTERIPDLVTAGLPMVAVRMPDHPVAAALLARAGRPIAAPSANRFGRPSPTTAQAVQDDLGDAVDLILDGGPTRVGLESTVVAFDGGQPVLLRPGGVTLESLERLVGRVAIGQPRAGASASPGMLARHYAPRTPLYLLQSSPAGAASTSFQPKTIGWLSFLKAAPAPIPITNTIVLGRDGRLETAAAEFFQALRQLDAAGLDAIIASPVEESGLGRALMDRLRRAASGWARVEGNRLVFIERGEGP